MLHVCYLENPWKGSTKAEVEGEASLAVYGYAGAVGSNQMVNGALQPVSTGCRNDAYNGTGIDEETAAGCGIRYVE